MKVFVGQSKLVGPISRYFGRFNFLEIAAEPGRCPRPSTLRQWREQAPKGFVFSVRLGRSVGAFDTDAEKVLEVGLAAAKALEAKWLLVQTPATLGPSQRNRDRLKKLFERLLATERLVAWEPRGVWEEDEVLPLISEVNVCWARDPSRYAMVEDPIGYGRIPALGNASRVGIGLAERAGEALQGFEEVYLTIEGDGAGRAAQIIRDIAKMPSEDESFVVGDEDGVEELSLGTPLTQRGFTESDEDESEEEASDEEGAESDEDEDSDEGQDPDEDEDDDEEYEDDDEDEEDLDELARLDDDEDDDTEAEPADDIDEADKKPEHIDDSDLPWAKGAKKDRRPS